MNIPLSGSVHELCNQVKKPIALSRASEASSLPNHDPAQVPSYCRRVGKAACYGQEKAKKKKV